MMRVNVSEYDAELNGEGVLEGKGVLEGELAVECVLDARGWVGV